MAKRKTPKVTNLRPEKITNEQLQEVQQIVSVSNKVKLEVGNIEARKHSLLHELDIINKRLGELNTKLEEQYGKVDIDINTGDIKYPEDEQANS
mgnify:CR=1 FL=1|jgi:hypothetical protein